MIDFEQFDSDAYVLATERRVPKDKPRNVWHGKRASESHKAFTNTIQFESSNGNYDYPALHKYIEQVTPEKQSLIKSLIESGAIPVIREKIIRNSKESDLKRAAEEGHGNAAKEASGFIFEQLASRWISEGLHDEKNVFGPQSTSRLFYRLHDIANFMPDDLITSSNPDVLEIEQIIEYKMNPENQHANLGSQIHRMLAFINKNGGTSIDLKHLS